MHRRPPHSCQILRVHRCRNPRRVPVCRASPRGIDAGARRLRLSGRHRLAPPASGAAELRAVTPIAAIPVRAPEPEGSRATLPTRIERGQQHAEEPIVCMTHRWRERNSNSQSFTARKLQTPRESGTKERTAGHMTPYYVGSSGCIPLGILCRHFYSTIPAIDEVPQRPLKASLRPTGVGVSRPFAGKPRKDRFRVRNQLMRNDGPRLVKRPKSSKPAN